MAKPRNRVRKLARWLVENMDPDVKHPMYLAWIIVGPLAVLLPESMTVAGLLVGVWILVNSTLVYRWRAQRIDARFAVCMEELLR